mmetsp:Transcript_91355/g.200147  ORF Transcript_91355/g.200147 Transcript_91355/m.200147 type:complete len:883 (+) Transcript_91355:226-2874(+)
MATISVQNPLREAAYLAISAFLRSTHADAAADAVEAACCEDVASSDASESFASQLVALARFLEQLVTGGRENKEVESDGWIDSILLRFTQPDAKTMLDESLLSQLSQALLGNAQIQSDDAQLQIVSLQDGPSSTNPATLQMMGGCQDFPPAPTFPHVWQPPIEREPGPPLPLTAPSAHYVPKCRGDPDGNSDPTIPEEYRDDMDPGYRIREVLESEMLAIIQEKMAASLTGYSSSHALAQAAAEERFLRQVGLGDQDDDELLKVSSCHADAAAGTGRTSGDGCESTIAPEGIQSLGTNGSSVPKVEEGELSVSPSSGRIRGFMRTAGEKVLAVLGVNHSSEEEEHQAQAQALTGSARQLATGPSFGAFESVLHPINNGSNGNDHQTSSSHHDTYNSSSNTGNGDTNNHGNKGTTANAKYDDSSCNDLNVAPLIGEMKPAISAASAEMQALITQQTMAGQHTHQMPQQDQPPMSFAYVQPAQPPEVEAKLLPQALVAKRKEKRRQENRPLSHAESGDPFYPVELDSIVFDSFFLRVVHERDHTGFEDTKEFDIKPNTIIAARYQVIEYLGSAAFSRAVQCLDLQTSRMVCMKIIKNDKDFLDQSLDEIKLLRLINVNTECVDDMHVLALLDYFYHKEHLIIVTELLRDNLYEFSKFNRESGHDPYFTLGRLQRITRQVLIALQYVHGLWLIHADLKPENILIKSYSRCEIKVIDFGSSCFVDDQLTSYLQSRSYRAPEVMLGLPYDQKIDLWSLGCIVAELWTGYVLFQNDSVQSLLARIVGIIGPFPEHMMAMGRYVPQYFTQDGQLYKELEPYPGPHNTQKRRLHLLLPKQSSLRQRMRIEDDCFIDFLTQLLQVDPAKRPTATEALAHPWLQPGRYCDGY